MDEWVFNAVGLTVIPVPGCIAFSLVVTVKVCVTCELS